jgi:hypothetical protein
VHHTKAWWPRPLNASTDFILQGLGDHWIFRSNTHLIWIYINCNHLFSFVLITIQLKFGWKPFSIARLTTKCSIVQWFDDEVRSGICTRRQEKKELHVTLNCKWSLHYCPYIFMDNFQHMGNCGSLHSSQCSNRQRWKKFRLKAEKLKEVRWEKLLTINCSSKSTPAPTPLPPPQQPKWRL